MTPKLRSVSNFKKIKSIGHDIKTVIIPEGVTVIKICVNTQTPLVRFKISAPDLVEKYGSLPDVIDLEMLVQGEDYVYSPGGVTAMVYPLLKEMSLKGLIENAMWVALSPESPIRIIGNGITFVNIDLTRSESEKYVRFKDKLWNEIHGIEKMNFVPSEYLSFNVYSWKTADVLLQNFENFDIYYIHDFQQLQIGNFVGPFAPAVFRWHIPANFDSVSDRIRKFVIRNMEAYDALIVSTKRDLEALFRSGYRGIANQVYPYIDEKEWFEPSSQEISEFLQLTGLNEDDRYFLVVARMDPIKGQDVAIRALKKLHESLPDVKLLLIGNGSFSGSSTGGLGSSKASNWRKNIMKLISEFNLQQSVILAGHMPDKLMRAAYALCDCVILPSKAEGFGLVTVEAWRMRKPVIVSTGAGSSELVVDGINGYTFPSGNYEDLAERMRDIIVKGNGTELGTMGYETAKQCYVENAIKKLVPIFERAMSGY